MEFGEEIICSICHEVEIDVAFGVCAHKFHRQCILRWLQICKEANRALVCPYCVRSVTETDLVIWVSFFFLQRSIHYQKLWMGNGKGHFFPIKKFVNKKRNQISIEYKLKCM